MRSVMPASSLVIFIRATAFVAAGVASSFADAVPPVLPPVQTNVFTWAPSPDAVNYVLFEGHHSGCYCEHFSTGLGTNYILAEALPWGPSYFTIAAISATGDLSVNANEVVITNTAPFVTLTMILPASRTNQFFRLQTSSDLLTWTTATNVPQLQIAVSNYPAGHPAVVRPPPHVSVNTNTLPPSP